MTESSGPTHKIINGTEYHWDLAKSETNASKHKVNFCEAVLVFSDPFRAEKKNTKHSLSESRFDSVGRVGDRHILVVYADVGDEDIEAFRLISAREATPTEIKEYRAGFGKKGI